MPEKPIELVQGTLEYLILQTLGTRRRMHGFEILEWIYRVTDEALSIEEGSLYPALHRMEKRGAIEATWGVSPKGRRAKYYALTAPGRRELAAQARQWQSYVAAVEKIATSGGE